MAIKPVLFFPITSILCCRYIDVKASLQMKSSATRKEYLITYICWPPSRPLSNSFYTAFQIRRIALINFTVSGFFFPFLYLQNHTAVGYDDRILWILIRRKTFSPPIPPSLLSIATTTNFVATVSLPYTSKLSPGVSRRG